MSKFSTCHQKSAGYIDVLSTPVTVSTTLPLNAELTTYFSLLKFEDRPQVGGFLYFSLFSSEELVDALQGWRWVKSKSGETIESMSWKPEWVIVGDRNGDAIFVDTSDGKVFGSIQGENFLIAETFSLFLKSLIDALRVEMEKYNFDVRTDDMEPLTEFEQDVKSFVSQKLSSEATAGFMEFFFG